MLYAVGKSRSSGILRTVRCKRGMLAVPQKRAMCREGWCAPHGPGDDLERIVRVLNRKRGSSRAGMAEVVHSSDSVSSIDSISGSAACAGGTVIPGFVYPRPRITSSTSLHVGNMRPLVRLY